MTRQAPWRRFAFDGGGAAIVEFTLVVMLLLGMTFGIIELAVAMWTYNAAEAGTRNGVRLAVESDPVATAITSYNAVSDSGLHPGTNLTLGVLPGFTVTCDDSSCACTGDGCRIIGNKMGHDPDAFAAVLAAVRQFFPRADADDLFVDYTHVGLGFAGRPGPDIVPLVTVRLRPLPYDFMAMNAFGLGDVQMPPFLATLPGEDLHSSGA